MAETCYGTKFYKVDYTKFGGLIFESDFDTQNNNKKPGRHIENIISDWAFDRQCIKDGCRNETYKEIRDNYNEYHKIFKEKLKERS